MMLRKLWKLSKYVYREVLFKSYVYQQNLDISDPEALKKALRGSSVMFYKTMMSIIAIIYPISTFFMIDVFISNLKSEIVVYYVSLILGSMVLMNAFLILMLGLMQSSVIFMPSIYAPLQILNLSDDDISMIALLTFFRVFDAFIIGVSIVSLILAQLVFRNLLISLLILAVQILVFILAIWGIIPIAVRFSRILMVPAVTKQKVLIRILFYSAYVFIISAVYMLPSISTTILAKSISAGEISPIVKALVLYVPPFSTFYLGLSLAYGINNLVFPIIDTLLLLTLAIIGARRITRAFRGFRIELPVSTTEEKVKVHRTIRLKSRFRALLDKDLKLLLRNVNYAPLLFLGPMIFFMYLILYIYGALELNFVINFSLYIASLYIVLAPSLVQMESKYLEFLRTLPIRSYEFIRSKALIVTISYLIYAIIVGIFTIIIKQLNIFAITAALNFVGVYSAIYIVIAKVLDDAITAEKSTYGVLNSIGFWIYAFVVVLFYYLVPYFLISYLKLVVRCPDWLVLALLLFLQLIYYLTTKLKKVVQL